MVDSSCSNLPSVKIFSMSALYSSEVAKPCAASAFTAWLVASITTQWPSPSSIQSHTDGVWPFCSFHAACISASSTISRSAVPFVADAVQYPADECSNASFIAVLKRFPSALDCCRG